MAVMARRGRKSLVDQGVPALVFLLPFMLLFCVFRVLPLVSSLLFSLADYDGLSRPVWVGFANYEELLSSRLADSRLFWTAVGNTLYYTVGEASIEMVVALGLALLVNSRRLWAKAVFRMSYYLPVITSAVAVSMVWLWLYNPQMGLFNTILTGLGLPRQGWLTNPKLAMPSIILMNVWQGAGWTMVVFLAGLQGIPESIYEAARIDGANGRQQLVRVTIPLMMPVIMFAVIMSCISGLQVFSQVYIMTEGGPQNSTLTVTYHIWTTAFRYYRMGFASAMSVLLGLVIIGVSAVNARVFGGKVEY